MFRESGLTRLESGLKFFESRLIFFESVLKFCESVLMFFEYGLIFFEYGLIFFESVLKFCESRGVADGSESHDFGRKSRRNRQIGAADRLNIPNRRIPCLEMS